MRNVSHRHRRAARKLGAAMGPQTRKYEIIAPNHRPDLRGEFAGGKVYFDGGKQYVNLTDQQARFYLDQGALQPVLNS